MKSKSQLIMIVSLLLILTISLYLIRVFYFFPDVDYGDAVSHLSILTGVASIILAAFALHFYLKLEDPTLKIAYKLKKKIYYLQDECLAINEYLDKNMQILSGDCEYMNKCRAELKYILYDLKERTLEENFRKNLYEIIYDKVETCVYDYNLHNGPIYEHSFKHNMFYNHKVISEIRTERTISLIQESLENIDIVDHMMIDDLIRYYSQPILFLKDSSVGLVDYLSIGEHIDNPIENDDILKYLKKGFSWEEGELLSKTEEIDSSVRYVLKTGHETDANDKIIGIYVYRLVMQDFIVERYRKLLTILEEGAVSKYLNINGANVDNLIHQLHRMLGRFSENSVPKFNDVKLVGKQIKKILEFTPSLIELHGFVNESNVKNKREIKDNIYFKKFKLYLFLGISFLVLFNFISLIIGHQFFNIEIGSAADFASNVPSIIGIAIASMAVYFYLRTEDPFLGHSVEIRNSINNLSIEVEKLNYFIDNISYKDKDTSEKLKYEDNLKYLRNALKVYLAELIYILNSKEYKNNLTNYFENNSISFTVDDKEGVSEIVSSLENAINEEIAQLDNLKSIDYKYIIQLLDNLPSSTEYLVRSDDKILFSTYVLEKQLIASYVLRELAPKLNLVELRKRCNLLKGFIGDYNSKDIDLKVIKVICKNIIKVIDDNGLNTIAFKLIGIQGLSKMNRLRSLLIDVSLSDYINYRQMNSLKVEINLLNDDLKVVSVDKITDLLVS